MICLLCVGRVRAGVGHPTDSTNTPPLKRSWNPLLSCEPRISKSLLVTSNSVPEKGSRKPRTMGVAGAAAWVRQSGGMLGSGRESPTRRQAPLPVARGALAGQQADGRLATTTSA